MKKTISKILAVLCMASFIGGTAIQTNIVSITNYTNVSASSGTVIYDASEIDEFANRTFSEVADRYAKAINSGKTQNTSYYSVEPSLESPYEAGMLTDDTLTSMGEMTEFYRWLIGVNPLKRSVVTSDELQAGALIRNFQFAHFPSDSSKPSDMSTELWEKGSNCIHNILAIGYTPQGAITGWMNEGYSTYRGSWGTLGHRYSLISYNVGKLGFGYSGSVAIGDVMDESNPKNDIPFYAFPAPGYMPNSVVYPDSSAWSVQPNRNYVKYDSLGDITVTVTNLRTGESYECTLDNEKLFYDSWSGEFAFVQPDDEGDAYYYTDKYSVEATGLKDSEGNPAIIRYTVNFVDVTPKTGDVNGDGKVNIIDAMIIAKYIAGDIDTVGGYPDMNDDGKVNISDLILICQQIVE